MEDLCDLLFEFSSTERMNIMLSLQEERLKLSHVSNKLNMTVTETSRHLQRLSDIRLIEKDVGGDLRSYAIWRVGDQASIES